MIIYMTLITYANGIKEAKFSGRKNQFGHLKKRATPWSGIAKIELKELHISASDFSTIDTVIP